MLGIACLMYTNCAQITLSDYQDSVIDNLINNIKENKVNHSHINNIFESFLDKVENDKTLNNKDDNDTNNKNIEACKINNSKTFIIKISTIVLDVILEDSVL